MGERDDASSSIEQTRNRMTNIVEELARRATPGYVGEQIKEATVRKTREIQGRVAANPYTLPVIGGVIGAVVASYFGRSRSSTNVRYDFGEIEEATGYRMEEEGVGIGEKARALKDSVTGKIHDAGEISSEKIGAATDKALDLGERAKTGFSRALDEQPLLIGAGLAVLGALVAVLTPVSEKEKRLVEPARQKAADAIQNLSEKIEEKLEGTQAAEPPENPSWLDQSGEGEFDAGSIGQGGGTNAGDGIEIGEGNGSFPPLH